MSVSEKFGNLQLEIEDLKDELNGVISENPDMLKEGGE